MAPIRDEARSSSRKRVTKKKTGRSTLQNTVVSPTRDNRRNLVSEGSAASSISAVLKNSDLLKKDDPLRGTRRLDHWKKVWLKKWKIDFQSQESVTSSSLGQSVEDAVDVLTLRLSANTINSLSDTDVRQEDTQNSSATEALNKTQVLECFQRIREVRGCKAEDLIKSYEQLTEMMYQEECQQLLNDLERMIQQLQNESQELSPDITLHPLKESEEEENAREPSSSSDVELHVKQLGQNYSLEDTDLPEESRERKENLSQHCTESLDETKQQNLPNTDAVETEELPEEIQNQHSQETIPQQLQQPLKQTEDLPTLHQDQNDDLVDVEDVTKNVQASVSQNNPQSIGVFYEPFFLGFFLR